MKTLCFEIEAKTEFTSLIKGDTLFSFLCGMIAEQQGQEKIKSLLENYTENQPFMIVSDLFPHNYLPRPNLPLAVLFKTMSAEDRKVIKQKKWLQQQYITCDVSEFGKALEDIGYQKTVSRTHNSVNPQTGRVDGEAYAPFTAKHVFYQRTSDVYIMYNEQKISDSEIETALKNAGACGIGRGASRGIGKFEIKSRTDKDFNGLSRFPDEKTVYYMTLSPCVPAFNKPIAEKSYYRLFTRFGKQYFFEENAKCFPFKKPVLTADTASVFGFEKVLSAPFIGCGFTGLSKDNRVVYQGYAPVVPLLWRESHE